MYLDLGNPETESDTNILEIEVPDELRKKVPIGIDFMDCALGGTKDSGRSPGVTPSNVIYFTGSPGSGKTTLAMQCADSCTRQGHVALFNTAEQNLYQVKMVAERLNLRAGFVCAGEHRIEGVFEHLDELRTLFAGKEVFYFQDSLQTISDPKYPHDPTYSNSKTPERALAAIASYAKRNYIIPVIIGQVNKSGEFAGNNRLLHIVDTHIHLYSDLEGGDRDDRLLEVRKNRFGASGIGWDLRMGVRGIHDGKH